MTQDLTIPLAVSADPQRAYDAINDVSGWWGRITGTTTAVGDEFVYVVPGLHYSGFRVTALEPARLVEWRVTGSYLDFVADKQEWNDTVVRFEIALADDGARIVFRHLGLTPGVECYGACATAWGTYVRGSLKRFIETGEGAPNSFEGDEALDAADHARLRERIEATEAARLDAGTA